MRWIIVGVVVTLLVGAAAFITSSEKPDAEHLARCGALPFGEGHRLVLVSIRKGGAASTMSTAGQDVGTTALELHVEPGREKLYVVASSYYPVIWKVTGERSRIANLLLLGGVIEASRSAVAAAGVSTDQVQIGTGQNCLGEQTALEPTDAGKAQSALRSMFGRGPDVTVTEDESPDATWSPAAISVPSGKIKIIGLREAERRPPPGFERRSWLDAIRFHPAGIMRFEPDEIEPKGVAVPYEVLPGQIGISALVASGHLQKMRDGPPTYLIVKPIPRFPADMRGGSAVRFFLCFGMPLPAGESGVFRVERDACPQ